MMFWRGKKAHKRQPAIDYSKNRPYIYRSFRGVDRENGNRRGRNEDKGSRLVSVLRFAGFVLGFLLFLVVLALASALGTNAKITIVGSQPPLRPTNQYRQEADRILGQSLNNRWKFSIKRLDIANAMKQTFPEIEEVSISTPPWLYKPVIRLTMSEPSVLLSSNNGEKYIVNEQGVALAAAKDVADYNTGNLPEVIDETDYDILIGENILSSEQVSYIKEILFQAKQKKLDTEKVLLKPGGQEVHFKFIGLGYIVKFSFDTDARRSAGAFLALKKHLDSKGPLPKEYIDVRVPERAYVR